MVKPWVLYTPATPAPFPIQRARKWPGLRGPQGPRGLSNDWLRPGFPFPLCSAIAPPKTNKGRERSQFLPLWLWYWRPHGSGEMRLVSVCPHRRSRWGLPGTLMLGERQGRLTRGTQRGFPLVWEEPDPYRPGWDPRVLPRHPNAPTLWLPPPSVLTGCAPAPRVRAGDQALFFPPGSPGWARESRPCQAE